MKKTLTTPLAFLLLSVAGCVLAVFGIPHSAVSRSQLSLPSENLSASQEQPIPTKFLPVRTEGAKLENAVVPDWNQISLSQLGAIEEGGYIGNEYNNQAGYKTSRSWQRGSTPDRFLKLGDLSEALSPEFFSLEQIASIAGLDLNNIALSAFSLASSQSIRDLVRAVPYLGDYKLSEVEPIAELVAAKSNLGKEVADLPLKEVVEKFPDAAGLKLGDIDLRRHAIADIPNLQNAPLYNFTGWQESTASEIPGLGQVPLAQMPKPLSIAGGAVARIDTVRGKAEKAWKRTVSGGDRVGFSVPCTEKDKACAHIELDDLENTGNKAQSEFEGKAWISGKYQEVEGGWGCLKSLNGGKEPTGRLPFGSAFKVAVMEPDETTDTVETALYFRACSPCGCSPYFIGPVKFLSFKRNAIIFLGVLEGDKTAAIEAAQMKQLAVSNRQQQLETERQLKSQEQKQNSRTSRPLSSGGGSSASASPAARKARPCTGTEVAGISLDGLSDAISSLESRGSSSYASVGIYSCADGGKNCGRALGKYQLMSYHPALVERVSAVSGGSQWLKKIEKGREPTRAEIVQFLPPAVQDKIFQNEMANLTSAVRQEIDPATGTPFAGERAIERAVQMWFGGQYSAIDAPVSDALGKSSLSEYGVAVREYYNANGGNPDCRHFK